MIVIDQAKIDAPDFPRPAEWWRRFVPGWVDVTVNDDGTVTLAASSFETRYTAGRGIWYDPDARLTAARQRRRDQALTGWVSGLRRLAVAVLSDDTALNGECTLCGRGRFAPMGLVEARAHAQAHARGEVHPADS